MQSLVWEYGFEGVHETPSLWDLVYTPIGGAVIGEARYRIVRSARLRGEALGWRAVAFAADPVGEIDAWIEKTLYGRRR